MQCFDILHVSFKNLIGFALAFTFESGINVPGRLLISQKNSTQDMFIPRTPFIQIWNIFHPTLSLRMLPTEKWIKIS